MSLSSFSNRGASGFARRNMLASQTILLQRDLHVMKVGEKDTLVEVVRQSAQRNRVSRRRLPIPDKRHRRPCAVRSCECAPRSRGTAHAIGPPPSTDNPAGRSRSAAGYGPLRCASGCLPPADDAASAGRNRPRRQCVDLRFEPARLIARPAAMNCSYPARSDKRAIRVGPNTTGDSSTRGNRPTSYRVAVR